MAVIVTDTRTVISEADNATGWTGGTYGTSTFVEAPGAIISTLNIATGQTYFTGTARDLTNTLVYIWSNNYALQGLWDAAAPPNAMHLGDGTNRVSFRMSGSDRKFFSHFEGQDWNWDCLVLDGSLAKTYPSTIARAGSLANLNMASITQFGADFTTLSKGLGGGTNVAVDIIRIGNDGLIITGGTTGSRGKFIEIVAEDRSTANLKAHGIIREYTSGIYGIQGPLTFGASTGTSWFEDVGITLGFENRPIANDKYYLGIVGGTGETHFILRNSTIATAGPFVRCDFNGNSINTFTFTGNTLAGLGNAVTFGTDTSAQSHVVTNNTFQGCGIINPGVVTFSNNTITNSTSSTTGALILDRVGANNLSNLSFISGGTGHAIYITQAGTYSFNNFTYSGYGTSGTTNAVVYNNSGGVVNINLSGGQAPTYRNGTGSTTNIVVSSTLTLTGLPEDTLVTIATATERDVLFQTTVGVSGEVSYSYGGDEAGVMVDVMFMNRNYDPNIGDLNNFILPTVNTTIPISLIPDRTYISSP